MFTSTKQSGKDIKENESVVHATLYTWLRWVAADRQCKMQSVLRPGWSCAAGLAMAKNKSLNGASGHRAWGPKADPWASHAKCP